MPSKLNLAETMPVLKEATLSLLGKGKSNAIPGRILAERLQEKDTRKIRLAIQELVAQGIPVIGLATHGYFIAETPTECKENLETIMSYIKMLAIHHKHLLRAAQPLLKPQQISMKLGDLNR